MVDGELLDRGRVGEIEYGRGRRTARGLDEFGRLLGGGESPRGDKYVRAATGEGEGEFPPGVTAGAGDEYVSSFEGHVR
ncbi:hypothetical protein GCM10010522_42150 [Kribbella solani]